jgi:hypothetical protein
MVCRNQVFKSGNSTHRGSLFRQGIPSLLSGHFAVGIGQDVVAIERAVVPANRLIARSVEIPPVGFGRAQVQRHRSAEEV